MSACLFLFSYLAWPTSGRGWRRGEERWSAGSFGPEQDKPARGAGLGAAPKDSRLRSLPSPAPACPYPDLAGTCANACHVKQVPGCVPEQLWLREGRMEEVRPGLDPSLEPREERGVLGRKGKGEKENQVRDTAALSLSPALQWP